jgi:hypothetical protein
MLETLRTVLRALDPKLGATVLGTVLARGVLELGGDPVGDPLWSGLVALAVGAFAGWAWPNAGTLLRRPQESGNAHPPQDVEVGGQ